MTQRPAPDIFEIPNMPRNESIETVLAAVADRTRVRILNLLRDGELCVCDLVEVLRLPQPKVSRHLAVLRSAGLVTMRIEQNWRHYRITTDLSALQKCVLACVTCCGEMPEMKQDRARVPACCAPRSVSNAGRNRKR